MIEFRRHLGEGRKLARAKKYQEALAAFASAQAIDPTNARVLSEIGWAALQIGDLDRARRANLDAVRFAPDNDVKGASLYNLGRIAEQAGQNQEAARYYALSLEIRDNATVRKRLSDLAGKGVEIEPAIEPECMFESHQAADVASLCRAIAAQHEGGGASCDESRMDGTISEEIDIQDRALTSAALFSLFVQEDHSDYVYIALRYRGAWHVSPVAVIYNPGAFGIFESLEITSLESEQLIPGGSPEVVLRFVKGHGDTDMGLDEEESSQIDVVAIFGVVAGKVGHLMAVRESYEYMRDRMGLMDDAELGAATAEGEAADETGDTKLPIERKSGVDVRFEPARGKVVIEARKDIDPSHQPGVYALQSFPVRCLPVFGF
jgi:hypothetical protein